MGRYEDPQLITDKRFETLNKGLSDLYSNVAKNAEAIKKRNEAKKQATLKRIEQWQKVYADKTGDSYRAALDFSETVDKDKNPNFIQNMKGTYAGGYDIIKNYIKDNPKASVAEIDNKVNELINSANSFTGGLVAIGALQKENNDGIKNIAQQQGLKAGNLPGNPVIGSGYENIFEQLGVSPGQEEVNMDKLGVVGNLETGISIFYDAPGEDGEYNNRMDEGEVLDLKVLSDQWQNGKNPYFAKTVDWNESLKTQKQILSKHEKSPLFLEEEIIQNDDGTTTRLKFVNKEKRTDYFLNGEGKPVLDTYINSLQAEGNRGLVGVAQSVGGIEFAKRFDANNPVHMDMLKRGVLEKMETTMYVGEGRLKEATGGTVSTTKTYQSSGIDFESISDVNKMDHKVLNDVVITGSGNQGPFTSAQISDLNEHFKGRPYNQGTDQLNKGKVDQIVAGSNPGEITVMYATGSGQRGQRSFTYNLNDPTERTQFEAAMLRGNFPNVPANKLSGVVRSTTEGTEYDDTKVTERTYRSERTGTGGTITEDDYKKMLEANEGQPTFDELLINLVDDQPAAASSAAASGAASGPAAASGVTSGSGSYGNNARINPQTNIVQFNFNGLNVDSDKAVAGYPVMTMKNDGDDYIRSMGNFETLAGNANGGGVTGYGFSGANAELAKLYKNAPGGNKEEKFIYSVNNYIIGQDNGNAKYGGKTTILTDLGISRSEFDALPEDVRKELVDWKFNTGRGTADVVLIAAGGDWDADRGYRSNSPTPDKLVVDDPSNPGNPKPIDLKNLDVAKLKAARQALYKGRIDGLKADIKSGKVNPNDKPKDSTQTYAEILKFAEDGYNNSQQYR